MTEQHDAVRAEEVRGAVDVAVLTIRDDELAAILRRLPNTAGTAIGRRHYNLRRLDTRGGPITVAVRCHEQGTGEAQSAATDVVADLDPPWVAVSGIGGAPPSSDHTLGDVVAATYIHELNVGALTASASQD